MLQLTDIASLTDFKRRSSEAIKRLKATGQPQVLTVNGRAELVVQDAESYQKMLDRLERAETLAAIRRGVEQADRGEGIPLDEAEKRLMKKHGRAKATSDDHRSARPGLCAKVVQSPQRKGSQPTVELKSKWWL